MFPSGRLAEHWRRGALKSWTRSDSLSQTLESIDQPDDSDLSLWFAPHDVHVYRVAV